MRQGHNETTREGENETRSETSETTRVHVSALDGDGALAEIRGANVRVDKDRLASLSGGFGGLVGALQIFHLLHNDAFAAIAWRETEVRHGRRISTANEASGEVEGGWPIEIDLHRRTAKGRSRGRARGKAGREAGREAGRQKDR